MLILSSCFILLINAVTFRRDKTLSHNRITSVILLYSTFLALNGLHMTCLETGIGIYGGLFLITSITQNFVVFMLILSFLILQLISFYPRHLKDIQIDTRPIENKVKEIEKYALIGESRIIDFPLVILYILIGAVCLMSSCDLITMFLCLELQSYGLYILSTIYRDSELATSAGLTYFLLGGLSSCFILLGAALLYVNTGLTNFDGIYILYNLTDTMIAQAQESIISLPEYQIKETWIKSDEINPIQTFDLSLLILSVGYLFKVSSAPFHFWSPDVYDSLPTLVTCFVAIMAKISIFIFLLDFVHFASGAKTVFTWTDILLLSSFFSLIIGTVVGLVQTRIKRLFAYSTISHVGFILLALTINTIESTQAFLFYLMQYSLSNLNFFFILLSAGYYIFYYKGQYKLTDEIGSPLQLITQVKGLLNKNYMLSISFAITLFSFAGIPPLIGFFGKQLVLSAALDKGYYFMALIAIITSVIGAVYYLGIIKLIFFDEDKDIPKPEFIEYLNEWNWNNIKLQWIKAKIIKKKNRLLSTSLSLMISILTLIILLFILSPSVWLRNSSLLALLLFNS
uniref:NADH-ubiquinone oxidoreductase chain 2 n=1 Tax=Dactylella tenuis TaxID=383872 RepID=A0A4Y5MZL2_9PEZI|nr:NADH dehydrogenase subunit 2 [Dactylella tenuis]QCW06826.1 NADH dehydrogenase subunit 2 [Dactylella tenuis]